MIIVHSKYGANGGMVTGETVRCRSTIKDWPEDERPRERLIRHGPKYLSDTQLLAIILETGNGIEKNSAVDLARELINRFGNFRGLNRVSYSKMCSIGGMGPAKYAKIKASLEIGKRFLRQKTESKKRIKTARDVVNYYKPYLQDLKREVFKVMLLDGRNKMIRDVTISEGSLTTSIVHPREVLKEIIKESAASVIFVHNHPSGEPQPTKKDVEITKRLVHACDLIDVNVLDHIVLGSDSHVSFADRGLLEGYRQSGH